MGGARGSENQGESEHKEGDEQRAIGEHVHRMGKTEAWMRG